MADEPRSPLAWLSASLLAVLLVGGSWWRSHAAGIAAEEEAARRAATVSAESAPAPQRDSGGAVLRLEVNAALAANASGPPLVLRMRAREGASRPFDVSAKEERTKQRFALRLELPVKEPELPLRLDLVGGDWCLPPGLTATRVTRLDEPFRITLLRARREERLFTVDGSGEPLAGVAVLHESGVELGVSGQDGRATWLRPQSAGPTELLFALAPGHVPAYLEPARGGAASPSLSALPLRPLARGGLVAGRTVDAAGAPVAGARVVPAYHVSDELPADPAARALVMALQASSVRELAALSVTSDAEGRFTLPLAWPGRVVVRAVDRRLGTVVGEVAAAEGLADAGRVTPLELRFAPWVTVRLELRRDGAPMEAIAVELVTRDAAGERAVAAGLSDAAGVLTVRAPCVTPLFALLRAQGQPATVRELQLEPTATSSDPEAAQLVPLELAQGRAVSGTVAGLPPLEQGARVVQLHDRDSRLLLGEALLAFDGKFRFPQVALGRAVTFAVTEPGSVGVEFHAATLAAPLAPDGSVDPAAEVVLGTFTLPDSGG
ncbi:MAG: hypothetical protein JNL90_15310 [Planctomycetes bacterium]|nr:hypothetical protein [Planctomycetota bacterium]